MREPKKSKRDKSACASGPLPTVDRIKTHRTILDALAALRGAYQALILEPPSTTAALAGVMRANEILAEMPESYAERLTVVLGLIAEIHGELAQPHLRSRILEASTALLRVARDVSSGRTS